jgi:hypothetical protein
MRAVMTFLRRLWNFGSDADAAVRAKRGEQLGRHPDLCRGQDPPG